MKTCFAFARLPHLAALFGLLAFVPVAKGGLETTFYFSSSSYTTAEGTTLVIGVNRKSTSTSCTFGCDWNLSQARTVTVRIDNQGHTYPLTTSDLPPAWHDFQESVTIPANQYSASISITFSNNVAVQFHRTTTLIFQNAGASDPSVPQSASLTLLDDDQPISVGVFETPPIISEGGLVGPATAQLIFHRDYTLYDIAVNYSVGGTATNNGSDFTPVLSGTVTIPNGSDHVLLPVTAKTDALAEGTETIVVTLQNGLYAINTTNSSTLLYIRDADAYSSVNVEAADGHAAEGGNPGVFKITRTGNTNVAVTALLAYGGTAVAGSDYTALPTNVTFAVGQTQTNLVVSPLDGGGTEAAETVVLTLLASTNYNFGLRTNAVVTIGADGAHPRDAHPKTERYLRGAGTDLNLYSEIIPMDGLRGYRWNDPEAFGYDNYYHYNGASGGSQASAANRLHYTMPLASFGADYGMPLHIGQSYSLGLCFGAPTADPLLVTVYRKSDFSFVTNATLATPHSGIVTNWTNFAASGFSRTLNLPGLKTVIRAASGMDWGHASGGFLLTHTASAESTNYFYLVEAAGLMNGLYSTLNASSQPAYGLYYELWFDQRPGWRSLFLDQPHFTGEPLPPHLLGRTPEELLNYGAAVTNAVSLSPAACTNLDHSPELRRHPVLDQFVSDLNSDPLALANYVFNEIDLSDPVAYRDDGSISTESLQPGGVNRNALAVYQEGQGSPTEQCALLIYLLRQAGVPAAYVFPPDGGLKLLDHRLSQLLRIRIEDGFDEQGRLYTTNRLLTVNYPWVAAYVDGQWVHLFPWLKQTEVIEGFNIGDYLPDPYKDMQLWVRDYVLGKTNLMAFAQPDDDTPATIFPRFLTNALQQAAPGLSVDDLGIQHRNRRMLYSRWDEFPRPTLVTNTSTAVESLTSAGITNVSPRLTNLFDTVTVELISAANPQTKIATAEMRMADLHNRKFFLTHTNVSSTNVQARLYLAPFRPDATNTVGSFDAGDTNLLNAQLLTLSLGPTDDSLKLRLRHRRQRALTWETALDEPRAFLDVIGAREVLQERPLRRGDVAAICFNTGRVTPAMLRVHAEELWNMERILNANTNLAGTIPVEVYQGSLTYLCGMSYYERVARFDELNRRWHKAQNLSVFAMGLAKISPRRDAGGALFGGGVDPIWPNVDMFFQEVLTAGNGTARLDSGRERGGALRNYRNLAIADFSAQEHAVLNLFFGQSNSVSTVKLLQLAQAKHLANTNGVSPVQELNYYTYESLGEATVGGKKLKEHDPSLWRQIVEMFEQSGEGPYTVAWMPPGSQTNASGSFSGMGALVLGPGRQAALIGNNQYGAYADPLATGTISPAKLPQWQTTLVADGTIRMDFVKATSGQKDAAPAAFKVWDAAEYLSELTGNAYHVNPHQSLVGQYNGQVHNGTAGSYTTVAGQDADNGSQGKASSKGGVIAVVADPVSPLTGEFYVDETDLVLPGPMPLVLRRNYSSQNLSANSLGHGWKLNYMPFLTLGTNNLVHASEPDGSTIVFAPVGTNLWAPSLSNNPTLHNQSRDGIGSTANPFGARLGRLVSGTNVTWSLTNSDGSVRVFEERSFPLGGTVDRLRPYLTAWYDCRSNHLAFEYGTNAAQSDYGQVRRVTTSSGNVLRLLYDEFARVVEALSLDGRRVRYDFDAHGDLRTVTRPDATDLRFQYEVKTWVTNGVTNAYSTHLLTHEFKPDGRTLVNAYDSQRRVTNQWATVGPDLRLVRNATFLFTNNFALTNLTNTITGSTTILDYTNRPTTLYYTNSLIRRIVDPLNRQTVQTWYEANETNAPAFPRSLKSVTDPRGLVTSYLYDTRGNATNVTVRGDLRGDGDTNAVAVTLAAYNTNNLPLWTVDARGTTNLFFYTNTWLLARLEVWPTNATAADAVTNLYAYGSVTNATNGTFSRGLRVREIRAAGSPDAATNEWDYEARGFVTRLTRHTGTGDPAVIVTNRHNYRGELVESVDAAGRRTKLTHDPNGRPQSREVFETGQTVPLAWEYSYYNGNGELTWSDGPRYDPEDYVWRDHDGAGRPTQEIRWRSRARLDGLGVEALPGDALFAAVFHEYDPFDNLVRTVDPRGNYCLKTYDAAGQRLGATNFAADGTALATNRWSYEPGGKVARHTNALGGVTETLYTGTGQPKFQRNADGSTNAWRYYADGRLRREILRNGSYWETTYADAARRVTNIFHSPSGAPLATNTSAFDRRGNLIVRTDAEGFAFTNRFDGLDRVKTAHGPVIVPQWLGGIGDAQPPPNVQQATTNFYAASGQVFTNANALGEKTLTTTDALGRPVLVEVRNTGGQTVRVTTNAYAATHHGVTTTQGTGANAIPTTTWTDTAGMTVLRVQFPAANEREFALTDFDAAGNAIYAGRFAVSNVTLTTFTEMFAVHDGLNRETWRSDRDGAVTTFAHDAAGNVTNQTVPGGLSRRATFNSAGQMTKDWFTGGSLGARTNTYAYYASNSVFAGLLQTRTDARGVVCSHGYDEWLRLATNAHDGPLPEHDLTTVWSFTPRGLATGVSESFASTNTGPATTVTRVFNAYGAISNETVSVSNGSGSYGVAQWWDDAGRRASRSINSQPATFNVLFGWRADGLLAAATGPTGGGNFSWTDAGLIVNRALGPRVTSVLARDGAGRPQAVDTTVSGYYYLVEDLYWTRDGLLEAHTVQRPDFTDYRSYSYASLSRRLVGEEVGLATNSAHTHFPQYDHGTTGGPGVLTRLHGGAWSAGKDALQRPATETNAVVRRAARGQVNGPATMKVLLDGQPMPVTVAGTNGGQWQSTLELWPGAHTLTVGATHPSGQFTAWATNTFTRAATNDTVTVQRDHAGFVTNRVWRDGSNNIVRTQTLTWDAKERLHAATERDALTNGYNWSAVYDALGRRLRTTTIIVSNGVALNSQPSTINQFYDPEHEFLEVGVTVNDKTTWKLHGPDLNGEYGGLNGTGGFEAIIPGPELFCPTIADARGNILAVYDVTHASFAWNTARPTGYGAVPGYRMPPLGHGGNLISASAWRGRWVDVIGSVWLGGRNLVMESGTFNSFDPQWNGIDPSGYSFAGGDPINYFDPDGRFSVAAAKKVWNAGAATLDFLGTGMAAAASAEGAMYADMAGNAEGAEIARGAAQASLDRQQMYVDAVVDSYNANRELQGSHLGAVNATFNPMYGVMVSGSEVTEGYGLRPENLGQRLDYEQKIDSAAGGAIDLVGAVTTAYGLTKVPSMFRSGAPEAPPRLHGNHLDSPGPHDVYVIRDATTGRIYHFGETGRGWKVRGSEWVRKLKKEHGLDSVVQRLDTVEGKKSAKALETRYIDTYEKVYGFKPGYVDANGNFVQLQKSRH